MIISFLFTAVLIELTPGPNMGWLALLSVSRGRAAGLAAVAGIALGLAIAGTAAALGLAVLFQDRPQLFQILRYAGAGYLLWLAVQAWREPAGGGGADPLSAPGRYFRQGLVSNILNPKAYLFYIAMLPGFIDPSQPAQAQFLLLAALYVAVATAIHAAIALFAGSFNAWFTASGQAPALRRTFAVLLAGVALWFLWSTRNVS